MTENCVKKILFPFSFFLFPCRMAAGYAVDSEGGRTFNNLLFRHHHCNLFAIRAYYEACDLF